MNGSTADSATARSILSAWRSDEQETFVQLLFERAQAQENPRNPTLFAHILFRLAIRETRTSNGDSISQFLTSATQSLRGLIEFDPPVAVVLFQAALGDPHALKDVPIGITVALELAFAALMLANTSEDELNRILTETGQLVSHSTQKP
ncbi:hypothetical protein ACFC1B_18015 [Streptomyces xiamenensis]|uniref:hypothetical protein n=1 Tax=Streptomyces xiamenensis TaxID=408015 RepID=UPI0035D6D5AC